MTRVLLVEDSPTQAQNLAGILEDAGFAVDTAPDAEQGFERLIRQAFDLVLSDLNLPGTSGFDLCRRIKANRDQGALPVVLLTRWADPVNVLQGLEAGADGFITKGREAEELVQRLNQVLARPMRPHVAVEKRTPIVYLGQQYQVAPEQLLETLLMAFEDQVFLKQRLEAELMERQRAEESFKAVVESTPNGMIMIDRDSKIVLVNAETEKLFGYSRDELFGQPIEILIPEQFRSKHVQHREAFFAAPEIRAMGKGRDLFGKRKDCSKFPVEVGINPVRCQNGPFVLVAISDITERKRVEAEILRLNSELEQRVEERTRELVEAHRILAYKHHENERSEKRLAGIIRSATDSILTLDAEHRITLFNAAAEKTFRCTSAEALGQPIRAFIRDTFDDANSIVERSLDDGHLCANWFEMHGVRADGDAFPLEASFSSTEVAGEKVFIIIIRDITDRRRTEQRKAAQYEVTKGIAAIDNLTDFAHQCLPVICETLGWDMGAVWEVDNNRNVLQCRELWHKPEAQFAEFVKQTRQITFGPGIDLPGRVWSSRQSICVEDVTRDNDFPRAEVAAAEGLRGAIAFPIQHGSEVVGIIEFFYREIRAPEPDVLLMVEAIGSQLGLFISRANVVTKLRERDAEVRLLLDSTAEGIYGIDMRGNCTFSNAACAKLLGYADAKDLLGQNMHRLIHHARADSTPYPERESCIYQAIREGREVHVDNEVFRRTDGVCFPAEYWSHPVLQDGKQIGAVITFLDVTERKQAEERLRDQAALLDHHANNAIIICDPEYRIRYWNRGAARLYGWTQAEAVGKTAQELIYKGSSSELVEPQQTVIEKGEWAGELRQLTKDGKEVIVASHWTLMRDEQGRASSILSINTDITEKKMLDAQLFRAQRMESIGTLAGGIAHDLNNVLSPILMAVELLKMKATDAVSKSFLRTLETSAARGAEMVKQILSFARGTEGQRQPLHLKHVVKDIAKMVEHTFPKSIEFQTSIPTDLWPIAADATQLHQVLMNLAVNARDAMPHGGPLTITAENRSLDENYARMNVEAKPGPYVLLTVTDKGTGIPADVYDKIFDPFFTTKEQGKGTGLGLSTVAGIVKNHGGFLSVYSEVGKGTQFSVYFPAIASAQTKEAEEADRCLPCGNGELILVVDDETGICEITKGTLEAHAYQVLTANDGTEALALYAQHWEQIRAMVIDMMMPILDGPTTIRAVRKLDPHARIIAVSGLAASSKAAAAASVEVQRFLPKPFTAETLLTALKEVLNQPAKADAEFRSAASPGEFIQRNGVPVAAHAEMS